MLLATLEITCALSYNAYNETMSPILLLAACVTAFRVTLPPSQVPTTRPCVTDNLPTSAVVTCISLDVAPSPTVCATLAPCRLSTASPTVKENLAEAGKKALDIAAPGAKAAIDIARGKVTNNRMEMVFEGVDRRSFSFSFKMMPKSESEAIAVDKIVNMFRFYMAPSFDTSGGKTTTTSRTFIVPATFDIEYYYNPGKQNKFLNRISTCVLESCNVTYGGERTQFFRPTAGGVHGDGAPPVETSIELSFKELEVITREKIAEGF